MKFPFRRLCLVLGLVAVLIALLTLAPLAPSTRVYAGQGAAPPDPVGDSAVSNGASMHNPGFDNHQWYEFHLRYAYGSVTGAWLPDDDTPGGAQDWRLWFLDGTSLIDTDPEKAYRRDGDRGLQMRPYDWGKGNNQLAGIYQVIYNTTPCFVYEFQMYGQSRPEDPDDYRQATLQVGIDQAGWHPDSVNDPAVHGTFPSTTEWGPSHDYKWDYGILTVTAEALNNQITVFTYGDAPGGRYHRVLWDTGSFAEVTQEVASPLIPDPDNPPAAGGISNLAVVTSTTSVVVNWNTPGTVLGQITYRPIATTPATPTGTLQYQVYLPLIKRPPSAWLSTPLNQSSTTVSVYLETISGLQPGTTYEYIVASRGASGGQCVTWVSNKETFTTATSP